MKWSALSRDMQDQERDYEAASANLAFHFSSTSSTQYQVFSAITFTFSWMPASCTASFICRYCFIFIFLVPRYSVMKGQKTKVENNGVADYKSTADGVWKAKDKTTIRLIFPHCSTTVVLLYWILYFFVPNLRSKTTRNSWNRSASSWPMQFDWPNISLSTLVPGLAQ